ncbi:hypothetical protein H5410_025471 [Solanum commersonii]|uniref:Uncharacterized protein n=1 Tax=Solanum commersonii TaxID=4109 RepID=A0A9J5YT71_SOLCO|nr:hypothetical protein H5410_025471 [Solanum commersonii]
MALKRAKIDGVSEALNEIASQNLDHAPARRRVRSAFVTAQQQLDHILLKVWVRSAFVNAQQQQMDICPKQAATDDAIAEVIASLVEVYKFFFIQGCENTSIWIKSSQNSIYCHDELS